MRENIISTLESDIAAICWMADELLERDVNTPYTYDNWCDEKLRFSEKWHKLVPKMCAYFIEKAEPADFDYVIIREMCLEEISDKYLLPVLIDGLEIEMSPPADGHTEEQISNSTIDSSVKSY